VFGPDPDGRNLTIVAAVLKAIRANSADAAAGKAVKAIDGTKL
jgi:hypothetical protein